MARRPVVLVVDDEREHRDLVALILRRSYDVRTAAGVDAAMEIADAEPIDVALVDYRMPGKPGTELLAHLHRTQPQCVRMLVTAYGDSGVLREAINAGHIYRYTAKPIDPDQLLVDLARAVEHRDAREMLQRSEKLALVGRFVGSVVHDLRNYLVVLRCTPDLLEAGDEESIADSVDRLRYVDACISDLVEELVGIARGKTPTYRRASQSLAQVAKLAVSLCSSNASFADRSVEVEIEAGLPDIPLAKNRCERMVTNLLLNAAQASAPGNPVRLRVRRDGPDHLAIDVCDEGSGIPPEIRDRIFDPLFTTKGDRGVGFGLAVCKAVVEGHGGTLIFETAVGRGTTFTARFPVS